MKSKLNHHTASKVVRWDILPLTEPIYRHTGNKPNKPLLVKNKKIMLLNY